jgi:hypothetical protein
VRHSQYFRAQARLYRDIAQLMTDRHAHDAAMASAADYLDRAKELEELEKTTEVLERNADERASGHGHA